MVTLEELARHIVNGLLKSDKQLLPDDMDFVKEQLIYAVNSRLEEVAAELDKLSQGTYTTAQTPAGLVRAMKVK